MKKPNLLTRFLDLFRKKDHAADRRKIIRFVQWVKRIVESPLADVVVKLTSFTDADDKFLAFLRKHLPIILNQTKLVMFDGSAEDTLSSAIRLLKRQEKPHRDWGELATHLYIAKTDFADDYMVAEAEIKADYMEMKQGGMLS